MANRKSENDVMLATRPRQPSAVQIPLPIQVKEERPGLTEEQRQHRENLEAFFCSVRKEAGQILLIAQLQNPEQNWGRLQEVPTPQLAQARAVYDQRPIEPEPLPHPELWGNYQRQAEEDFGRQRLEQGSKPKKPKQPQAYKPWPLERRQRLAASKLRQRAIKRSTFPEFWIPAVQEQIMQEPWRFGVCPLPSEDACIIPNPDRILSRQKAIAYEVECRQKEALPEPLEMPLRLEQREAELVEVRSKVQLSKEVL